MGPTRIVASAIVALSFVSAACAQETLKGEVAIVDEASGKIGVKLSGTVDRAIQPPQPVLRSKMVSFSMP